jgi:hypothetical protein
MILHEWDDTMPVMFRSWEINRGVCGRNTNKVIFLSLHPLTNPVDTTIYTPASHNHHILSPNHL